MARIRQLDEIGIEEESWEQAMYALFGYLCFNGPPPRGHVERGGPLETPVSPRGAACDPRRRSMELCLRPSLFLFKWRVV